MNLRRLLLAPLALATLLLPAACAQSSRPTPATAPSGEKAPSAERNVAVTAAPGASGEDGSSSLEAQISALAAAEGQLDRALEGAGKKKNERDDKDEAPPKGGVAQGSGDGVRGGSAPQKSPSFDARESGPPCAMACSALASMSRAVSHLCSLAGEGDRRCEDGRSRERSATQRVFASCPSCSG